MYFKIDDFSLRNGDVSRITSQPINTDAHTKVYFLLPICWSTLQSLEPGKSFEMLIREQHLRIGISISVRERTSGTRDRKLQQIHSNTLLVFRCAALSIILVVTILSRALWRFTPRKSLRIKHNDTCWRPSNSENYARLLW